LNVPQPLLEAWRADTASPAELRRGYARYLRRRPVGGAWLRLLGRVAAGLVLGVGLAQAANLVHAGWVARQEPWQVGPSAAKPPHTVVGVAPSISAAPVSSASAGAATVPPVRSASGHPHFEPPPGFVQEQWQQAAAALRDRDFVRAEAAFIQIERGVGGVEGDAARLARAQLLASYGRTAEARTLASDLQEHARSALVRDKAGALWTRLSKIAGEHRSTEAAPAIKQP
jgi:hypothetical protein